INADCLGPFGILTDGRRARHAQSPQTKANANFDAAHTRASLHKSGGTVPDSLTVLLLTLRSASQNQTSGVDSLRLFLRLALGTIRNQEKTGLILPKILRLYQRAMKET